jgi:hypothetical protein
MFYPYMLGSNDRWVLLDTKEGRVVKAIASFNTEG